MKQKKCFKCKKIKDIKEFNKNRTTKDGLQNWCCECKNEYNKNYRKQNKQKLREYHKIKDRERYLKNKEKILQQHKKYDENHKEEKRKLHVEYYYKNKDKFKKYALNYINIKRKKDKKFKLKMQLRNMIRFSFYRKGKIKSKKTEEIVGISINELYKYLLKTFKDNYGYEYENEEVEIDHIIPLSTAKTEENIIKLCNYKNLQLLKKEDNRIKSNKLNWELNK